MEALFAFLHVADAAIAPGATGSMGALVRAALRADLATLLPEIDPSLDAVLATGDLVRAGDPSAYDDARAWLAGLAKAAGLGLDRVFTVPGDRDRAPHDEAERIAARLVDALREGREDLDEALANPLDRARLEAPRLPYRAFASAFAAVPAPGPEWSCRVSGRRGLEVRLVGLDTALLARGRDDRGKLRIGVGQIVRGLDDPGNDLVIALSHHPFEGGWIADEPGAARLVEARAHVHLTASLEGAPGSHGRVGRVVRVAAGGTAAGTFGYRVAAVIQGDASVLRLRVWPRRFSHEQVRFVRDVDRLPSEARYVDHDLAFPWTSPPSARVPPGLLESVEARCQALERLVAAAAASAPAGAREAMLRLELERALFLGGMANDERAILAAGAAVPKVVRARVRELRYRTQRALARGGLRLLLARPDPPEAEVFGCSSKLAAIGEPGDLALLEEAARRLPFDFLPSHARALAARLGP
jgi:hypothetical protein